MRTTRLALAAAGLIALVLCGCANPFAPAKSPTPDPNSVTVDFRTTDKLLQTMADGISNKTSAGASAYLDALADSSGGLPEYYAFYDAAVVHDWSGDVPNPWDLGLERRFINSLFSNSRFLGLAYQMAWGPDNTSPIDQIDDVAGTALLHRFYQLQASNGGSTNLIVAQGYADLYLVKRNSRWYLYRWQDRLDPTVGVTPSDPDQFRTMGWLRLDSQAG